MHEKCKQILQLDFKESCEKALLCNVSCLIISGCERQPDCLFQVSRSHHQFIRLSTDYLMASLRNREEYLHLVFYVRMNLREDYMY